MQRPDVLDRLAKLLSKTTANGATEAESQTAMAMAQRLMDEHNLTSSDVETGGSAAGVVEFIAWEKGWAEAHYVSALATVQEVFTVAGVIRRYRQRDGKGGSKTAKVVIVLYGDAANVEAASWALEFLATTFKGLWDRHRVATKAPTEEMTGYFLGLRDGFKSRSEASRADLELTRPGSSTALSLRKSQAQEAAEAANPGMKVVKKKVEGSSYEAGVRDGRSINLARSVGQGGPKQLAAK